MYRPASISLNRFLAATSVLLAVAAPAFAQSSMTLATSPALACLTIPGGAPMKPEYPSRSLERREGGTVKVQLEFRAPGDIPLVKVLERAESDQLNDVVKDHVKKFRVPCMRESDGPVTLVQAYVFDPDSTSRVVAASTRDTADIEREAKLQCMQHQVRDSKPRYPTEALRRDEQGNFIVKMHFSAKDQAPAIEFMGGPASRTLRRAVEDYSQGLRLPCMESEPVDAMIAYLFTLDDDSRTMLRDASLAKLLGGAKNLARPAYFNFNATSCPFEVRMSYYQPFAHNELLQLDTAVAARQPLLDWLEGLTLNLDEQTSAKVFGNKMIISVPCGKLDI